MQATDLMKTAILVQLFYAIGITLFSYALCGANGGFTLPGACNYVTGFSLGDDGLDIATVSSDVQSALEQQTNIPVVELGALVFYSGNILLDLFLNFVFAIPEMVGMLVNGVLLIFNIDNFVFAAIQIFVSVVTVTFYLIAGIEMLTNVRSGRVV